MYKLNNFVFKLINHDNIPLPENMSKFYVDAIDYDYIYELYVVDKVNVIEDKFTINKDKIKVIVNNGLEKRYLVIPGDVCPYAISEEIDKNHTIVHIRKDYVHMMIYDTMFNSLLSLERRMLDYNCFILHSSYMVVNNKAILFSAPSGTGKSTQASLWEKYRNAFVVNGDRSLLSIEDNKCYACGWPICGSSEICFNEKHEVSCIVLLSQAKENNIVNVDYKTGVKKLLGEVTINYHNGTFVNSALDFIDKIISTVPIYHLACDISENAVVCLENKIKEDKLWML